MVGSIFQKLNKNKGKEVEDKPGPLGRGKNAIMSLLAMIEGSKERDTKTWIRIFETVADFRYSEDPGLTEKELTVLDVILHSLLSKVPVNYRREFADFLSRREEVSEILTESLITDELTVAAPILARSEYLTEDHYKAAITQGTTEHRSILAGRKELPNSAVEALLESRDPKAQKKLLKNDTVILGERSFLRLLSSYLGDEKREAELLDGPHLTPALAYQSWWDWTSASKQELLERFQVSTDVFGEILNSLLRQRGEGNAAEESLSKAIALHDRLDHVVQNGFTLVMDQSNIDELVEFMLNGLCLGPRTVKRILTDRSGLSLAIFLNALGLRGGQFEEIYGHLHQRDLDMTSYANFLSQALGTFNKVPVEMAANLVTIWSFGDLRPAEQMANEAAA